MIRVEFKRDTDIEQLFQKVQKLHQATATAIKNRRSLPA